MTERSSTASPPTAPPPPSAVERGDDSGSTARRRVRTAAWLVPFLLVIVAGSLRFYRLDEPERIYFDEVYYVTDANQLLDRGVEEGFVVHPPLGKWMIAGGIAAFGDNSFGWRASSALAGTLTVLMVYVVGVRLFRRRGIAALAALLVTVDGLAFTMSRIAMLDAFLALLVVIGVWFLLLDRDEQWRGIAGRRPADAQGTADGRDDDRPDEGLPVPRRPHRFRWLAGVAFGVALGVKWSALLAIGAAGLFVLGSELAFRRRTTGRWFPAWGRIVASGLLTLVAVPALIYLASYAGWFANFELTRPGVKRCGSVTDCAVSPPDMLADWWGEQNAIAGFHDELDATHGYRASAATWPAMLRPVAYYYESCSPERRAELQAEGEECAVAEGNVAEILGMGNPAIWWLALLAYPGLLWFGIRRRDWRAAAIGVFLVGQYLPWLIADRPLFLFYMTPIVPFVVLALAYCAGQLARSPMLRWVPLAVGVLAVAGFLFWYPLLSGMEISQSQWTLRIWTDRWI
jgi:dolichyl-phosphate-mannose-protein mannosyltransferase